MASHRVFACAAVASCLVLPALFMAGSPIGRAAAETTVAWTIGMYIDADNDFDEYWEGLSLLYLQNIPESVDVNIVAFVDRMSYPGTELWEIEGSTAQIVETFPEMNFGDGATLSWMISETATRYPSEHLLIDAWDHGSAWNGFCGDYTSDDWIYLDELKAAIIDAGVYIDILSFDACSMSSIETLYTVSLTGLVDIVVASLETVANDGFPYDLMFTPVALDPLRTPDQVASDMIDGWAQYYDPQSQFYYATLSAVSIGSLAQSMSTISAWCDAIHANLDEYYRAYKSAVRSTYSVFYTKDQVDMVDLGNQLLANSKITDPTLRALTQDMVTAVEDAVLYLDNSESTMTCGGMTIWWSASTDWNSYSDVYVGLDFALDTGWDEFLADYTS
ncbi:MAG: clostripain-related cysteine peptidase [Thermoplasmata archaeon]|nr:clostripain-related cysteine peptidase [Thermoplasmata archaeon]